MQNLFFKVLSAGWVGSFYMNSIMILYGRRNFDHTKFGREDFLRSEASHYRWSSKFTESSFLLLKTSKTVISLDFAHEYTYACEWIRHKNKVWKTWLIRQIYIIDVLWDWLNEYSMKLSWLWSIYVYGWFRLINSMEYLNEMKVDLSTTMGYINGNINNQLTNCLTTEFRVVAAQYISGRNKAIHI